MNNDKKIIPTQLATKFLRWFCPPSLYESIEGDLLEQFEEDVESIGERRAKRRFILNVIRFLRPGIVLRNTFSWKFINSIMIENYFKIALRNLTKRKLYSFINSFGLSIAIAFCTLIYLFIQDEYSFDRFHQDKDQLFRLESVLYVGPENPNDDPFWKLIEVPDPVIQIVKNDFPEVEFSSRFLEGSTVMHYGDQINTQKIHWIDTDFFRMFSFPIQSGTPFQNKDEVVITSRIADKYFKTGENPIGKMITLGVDTRKLFTIAGIIQNPPDNSSLDFDILISAENWQNYENYSTEWGEFAYPFFVKLTRGTDAISFKSNLNRAVDKAHSQELINSKIKPLEFNIRSIEQIHLTKEFPFWKSSDPQYSWILTGIALVIVLIACVNYISMSLISSASRKIEVGIRKVIGAKRIQLLIQFSIESVLLTLISVVLGLLLVAVSLPSFNEFTGKSILYEAVANIRFAEFIVLLILFVGLLAGTYPSLLISGLKPVLILKNWIVSRFTVRFTYVLVFVQFSLSSFLIICAVVMLQEMKFIARKNLGFNKSNVVVLSTGLRTENSEQIIALFKQRAERIGSIESVSSSSDSFYKGLSRNGFEWNREKKSSRTFTIDKDYLNTLQIKLATGRDFNSNDGTQNKNEIIVNESFVRQMGWITPLEETIQWSSDTVPIPQHVIGVVSDYHFRPLNYEIEPLILTVNAHKSGYRKDLLIKISSADISSSMNEIKQIWKEVAPDLPFEYSFLDKDTERQYESYQRWTTIMTLATLFAIVIACLGLFGLAGISAINRTREISIRRVMGASLNNVFVLLNKKYVILSILSFVFAAPVSWMIMKQWLANFKYRIDLDWQLFAISLLSGLAFALVSVSYHTIKTVRINPAETLKNE